MVSTMAALLVLAVLIIVGLIVATGAGGGELDVSFLLSGIR